MTNIQTLIPDIHKTIKKRDWFTNELAVAFSTDLSKRLQVQLSDTRTGPQKLRMSKLGNRCPRALWYSIHHPELAEPLPPQAEIKYSFGHMIEALAILLAKAAGHEVTGEQDEVELDGVLGHRDCIIDGCIVDVKSASSLSFAKFKNSDFAEVDSFGYLDQLDGYVVASRNDPLVRVKDKGYILAVEKQLGAMHLYEHTVREEHIRKRIARYFNIINLSEPPPCTCRTVKSGESGNIKLDPVAGYSPYKHCCFPFLRTFLYAKGPEFLTVVKRRPQRADGSYVPEVNREGKVIY